MEIHSEEEPEPNQMMLVAHEPCLAPQHSLSNEEYK